MIVLSGINSNIVNTPESVDLPNKDHKDITHNTNSIGARIRVLKFCETSWILLTSTVIKFTMSPVEDFNLDSIDNLNPFWYINEVNEDLQPNPTLNIFMRY